MVKRSRTSRALHLAARVPFTLTLTAALLLLAVLTGTHLTPFSRLPWFDEVAAGLPAFTHGRWWSLATSPWFVTHPLRFLLTLPLVVGAVGWAEVRFGSLRTLGLFFAGHLLGTLGAAATIALTSRHGWDWAMSLSRSLEVGPSTGALACLVFAIATLPSPWRLRARFAVGAWAVISVVYVGHLMDVQHAIVAACALAVSGSLPAFRHRAGRPTVREWRLLAFAWLVIIGVVEVFNLIPFDGPFGSNDPFLPVVDVLLDLVVIAVVAHGVRVGMRLAWIATLTLAVLNVGVSIVAALLMHRLLEIGFIEDPEELTSVVIPSAVLWAVQLTIMVAGRGAFQVRLKRGRPGFEAHAIDRETALSRLRSIGDGTISWMIGWRGNQRIAVGSGVMAYQAHAGVAIALGNPVVPDGEQASALEEFARTAEYSGLIPCVFSADAATADARPAGWRRAIIAEDTIVDLPGLSLRGKRWNSVRTSLNRAEREGISFRLCTLSEEPRNVLAQVRALSEQWAGDRGLPEMGFTLGTVEEALDPETRVGIAVDDQGTLHGITSWLPVYGPGGRVRGWTLDLMRRRDDAFGPVMEFLIGAAALHFAEEGYEFVSLSGAPLVRPTNVEPSPVERVLDRVGELIEPLYGFRSLHRFKQKFNPRSEPLHLLYRDEGDLPRIAVALTRAYLPDATLRDLIVSTRRL